jgi:hypothetical protein
MYAPIHYAVYIQNSGAAIYGTAEMLPDNRWLFRSDDDSYMEACRGNDHHLHVSGHVALADAQLADDLAARYGETAGTRCPGCGLIGCRGDQTCDGQVVVRLAAIMAA